MSPKPRFAPGLLTGTHTYGAPTNSDQGCGTQLQREEYKSNPTEHVRSTRGRAGKEHPTYQPGVTKSLPRDTSIPTLMTSISLLSPTILHYGADRAGLLVPIWGDIESLGGSVYPPPDCTPDFPLPEKVFLSGAQCAPPQPPAYLEDLVIHPCGVPPHPGSLGCWPASFPSMSPRLSGDHVGLLHCTSNVHPTYSNGLRDRPHKCHSHVPETGVWLFFHL